MNRTLACLLLACLAATARAQEATAYEPMGPPAPDDRVQGPTGPALARLRPAEPGASPAISEAEQIAQLRRSIELDEERLGQKRGEMEDPEGEYSRAEAEFQQADERLAAMTRQLRELTEAGAGDEAEALEAAIAEHRKAWTLAKDRFDLAIEDRRTLKEQVAALEKKIAADKQALAQLDGTAAHAEPEAPAPAATDAPPTAATSAPAPAEAESGAATAPAQDAATDAAATAEAKPPSKEFVAARADEQAKAEAAREAEREETAINGRIEALDRDIALEKKQLETARKKADNAHAARGELARELQERSVAGAPADELKALVARGRDAEARSNEARDDARAHTERLEELHSERAELLAQQVAAHRAAEDSREQLEEAQDRVRQLQNPFAPRNVLLWAIDHGPKMLAIVLAMAVLRWTTRLFSRRIVRLMSRHGARGTTEEREARANTLIGVFHNAASVSIALGGVLMVLQEAGIPIAPLLGGAAVFGLAVAFGAQNLIRDYFYGFVILLENQYKLNDVVKIGELSGQVEQITLRMTVLRDLEGNVHFVPNGQITAVTNMTHGWSRALFDIGVAYKEDVDRVMTVLADLGRDLRRDPAYGPVILDDPTMLGVDSLGDSAVVIKFFIKTRPLQQWTVKRELLRRIKNKFDELGIEIPYPHRVVSHRFGEAPAVADDGGPDRQTLWFGLGRSSA